MALGKALFVVGSMAAMAMGRVVNTKGECGAPEPTEEHISIAKQLSLNESMVAFNSFATQANVNVPVYVHVIAKSGKASGGYASEKDVRSTVAGMTKDYENMGFQFSIKDIDWTINADWAQDGDELAMKRKLRKGDYKTLNLYYINDLGGPNGYCYFPTAASPGSDTFYKDGCSIQTDKMTNGQTTTHEVGHWLGLFHTFQGGCSEQGDLVDDTPACQKSWSCDESQDTCPDLPGNDAVHNFMAYGTCRQEFTPGQGTRARSSYNHYRA